MIFSEPMAFSSVAETNSDEIPDSISTAFKERVLTNGAAYVRTTELLSKRIFQVLSREIGAPLTSDAPAPDFELGLFAHRVEVAKKGTVVDKFGRIPLSTTSQEINFHTEDYFEESPSDIILFRCVRQSHEGGLTKLSFLKEILQLLKPNIIDLLSSPVFPTYSSYKPILSEVSDLMTISFNPHVIARATSEGAILDEKYVEAVESLIEASELSSITMRLAPNDILVINNKTVLHARTEFPSSSDRLIYRIKVTA